MKRLKLKHSCGEYEIIQGRGVLSRIGDIATERVKGRTAVIVTDSNVAPLYAEKVERIFVACDFDAKTTVVPAGEESKSLEMLNRLYGEFNRSGLTRADVVIALGGGVVGDLAGFAAGTYMRGIAIIQAPTTFLAQIDSSVGGKTGIDLEYGKNLAGIIKQPLAVVADTDCLETLSEKVFAEGLAEALKYGLIKDAALFESLEKNKYDLEDVIYTCVSIKKDLVEADEFDCGARMMLNFGHTIGHAIEKAMDYKCTHGEAVAAGMIVEAKIGEKLGVTAKGTARRIQSAVRSSKLPEKFDIPVESIIGGIKSDKKKQGNNMNYVYLHEIGVARVLKIPMAEFENVIRSIWNE
ncbi:MAG TPA: 3-dehydroquinate synthase [Clostridia bacterium]|nr:3-dehydroquinate synthase [Clostridia bacterium]